MNCSHGGFDGAGTKEVEVEYAPEVTKSAGSGMHPRVLVSLCNHRRVQVACAITLEFGSRVQSLLEKIVLEKCFPVVSAHYGTWFGWEVQC